MISSFSAGLGPIGKALGWMIIHSLWQISLIALILALVLRMIPRKQANTRYALLLIGLVAVVCWSGMTFQSNWVYYAYVPTAEQGTAMVQNGRALEVTSVELAAYSWEQSFQQTVTWLDSQLNLVTFIWGIGVVLSCLYFIMGLSYLHYLQTYRVKVPEPEWVERFTRLSAQMGIRRKVRLLLSEVVQDPITFRLLRPVILLPTSLMTGLEPKQIELLLLHELAHIRRYDFTVNILQTLVEIVFFYHPALWWISRNIRTTREHCCDDAVLAVQNQPVLYAEALTRIPTSNLSLKKRLAMSANNNKGILSQRIFRLFGQYESQPPIYRSILMAFLLLVLSIGSQAFLVAEEPVTAAEEVIVVQEDQMSEMPQEELVLEPATSIEPAAVSQESPQVSSAPPVAEATAPIIEGKVMDEDNQPIVGVSILVKNTTTGTVTDFDGTYRLKLPTECATLIFSYVGRQTQEIEQSCGGQKLDVILPATVDLGEVVVIGRKEAPESTIEEATSEKAIISGTVKDENGQPLIGTSILIKDTKIGTITDLEGNYRLSLPSECATLIFSYIGKVTQEIEQSCGGQKLDVVLPATTEPGKIVMRKQQPESATEKAIAGKVIITGVVKDGNNQPLIGTNVLIKDTKIGTITDLQGNYRISLPDECATLIFSYIGKETQEVANRCGSQKLDVVLREKTETEEQIPAAAPTLRDRLPEAEITPSETKVLQDLTVFPNPSSGVVTVSFKLAKATKVVFGVYTIDGKLMSSNVLGLGAGTHRHVWQDENTKKGTYLIQIQAEGEKISKPLIIE